MIAIIQEQFEHNTANLITRFLEHPTAPMIRRFREYTDLLTFDARNDWHQWQSLYGFQTINGSRRAYMTYGGGPEGGIVRLRSSMTLVASWYVWHRDWGRPATVLRIPRELTPVTRREDDYEAIKLVMVDDYELAENEYYLDDLEDSAEEQDSDYGLRNDDGDEADERRENDEARWGGRQEEDDDEAPQEDNVEIETNERDPETDAEDEMEDEAEDYEALVSNEMREEVAALVEQIRDYSERMGNESNPDGYMTLCMLIHQANERCRELRMQLAARRHI